MAPQKKWNKKPPKLQTPAEVANSGDPYSCLSSSIYFCTHLGFNNWYQEHLTKFFGEVEYVPRRRKKKKLDMGSSVHDILATSTKSNSNGRAKSSGMDRSNSSNNIIKKKQSKTSRNNNETTKGKKNSKRTRSKSPIKVPRRDVSSAPAKRSSKKRPSNHDNNNNNNYTKNNKTLSTSPVVEDKLYHSMSSTKTSKSSSNKNLQKAYGSSMKGKQISLRKTKVKAFLPEKKKPNEDAKRTINTSERKETAVNGKKMTLATTENCIKTIKLFISQNGKGDENDLINSVDEKDVVAAVRNLTSKSAAPEVTVKLAQQQLVKSLLLLLKVQTVAPWTVYSLLCLTNMTAFLLRSRTARDKYFTINIIQHMFQMIGTNTIECILQNDDNNTYALSVLKASVKLLSTITQASEGDARFEEAFKTHGGLHTLVLASQCHDVEASKLSRVMLGKFSNDELNALLLSTSLFASSSNKNDSNAIITNTLAENVTKEIEKRDALKQRHKLALSRERNVALKAHEAVEQRRKKQSEFINNVDEKSLLLRDKIKKRMEVINARKEKAEQMEKEKVQEEMQRKRQELIKKRKEIDEFQRRKREKEREKRKLKEEEELRISIEKEKKNEEMMKAWLENKKKETQKKHEEEIKKQQREHEQNLEALQLMRKQMEKILAKNKHKSKNNNKKKKSSSKSPRRKRDEVDNVRGKVGLKFKVTNVNKPSSTNSGSSFPPLQNYSFEEVDRYKDRNHRYGGGGRENKDVNRVFVPRRPTMT